MKRATPTFDYKPSKRTKLSFIRTPGELRGSDEGQVQIDFGGSIIKAEW